MALAAPTSDLGRALALMIPGATARVGADSQSETPSIRESDPYGPVALAQLAANWAPGPSIRLSVSAAPVAGLLLVSDEVEKVSVFAKSSVQEVSVGDVVIEPVAA